MNEIQKDQAREGEQRDEMKSTQPSLIQRTAVAVADEFGWLHDFDSSIVKEFRRKHPVINTSSSNE